MNRQSKRFTPSRWMEMLVPLLLGILAVGLLFVLGLVIISMI